MLAQILDYARTVQENWPTANLVEKFRKHGPWVSENEDDLKRIARTAEFLLIVAGDGIDDSMERLARRFAGHDDPLSLSELALVSMPLYALDEQFLLIPHVVTAVQRRERGFTLRVVVQDYEGHEVTADGSGSVWLILGCGTLRAQRGEANVERVAGLFCAIWIDTLHCAGGPVRDVAFGDRVTTHYARLTTLLGHTVTST